MWSQVENDFKIDKRLHESFCTPCSHNDILTLSDMKYHASDLFFIFWFVYGKIHLFWCVALFILTSDVICEAPQLNVKINKGKTY